MVLDCKQIIHFFGGGGGLQTSVLFKRTPKFIKVTKFGICDALLTRDGLVLLYYLSLFYNMLIICLMCDASNHKVSQLED